MFFQDKVGCFRSQMLMGRYQKAISLGETLLQQMEQIQKLTNIKIQSLYQNIKEQYEITKKLHFELRILKDQQRKKTVSKWEGKQKSNLNQIIKSKWQSPKFSPIKVQQKNISQDKCVKKQQKQQICNEKQQSFLSEESMIEQQLHRQIILPLNMPELFKLKTRLPLIQVSDSHIQNVLSYLKTYDFQLIKTLPQLNVQHMMQLIDQMDKRCIIRGVMIFCQDQNLKLIKILQQLKQTHRQKQITLISIIKVQDSGKSQKSKFLTFS